MPLFVRARIGSSKLDCLLGDLEEATEEDIDATTDAGVLTKGPYLKNLAHLCGNWCEPPINNPGTP